MNIIFHKNQNNILDWNFNYINILQKDDLFYVYIEQTTKHTLWLEYSGKIITYKDNYYIINTENPYKIYYYYYYILQ